MHKHIRLYKSLKVLIEFCSKEMPILVHLSQQIFVVHL